MRRYEIPFGPAPTLNVDVTCWVLVSIADTVPASMLVTKAVLPLLSTTTPWAPGPVVTVANTLPLAISITETLSSQAFSLPWLATYTVLPFELAETWMRLRTTSTFPMTWRVATSMMATLFSPLSDT